LDDRLRLQSEADQQRAREQAALADEASQRLAAKIDDLSTHLAEATSQMVVRTESLTSGLAQVAAIYSALDANVSAAAAGVAERSTEVAAAVNLALERTQSVADDVAWLKASIELILRRPAGSLAINTDPLRAKSEEELIAIAESIAFLRPLVPYPGWRFDADLANPDLAFQLRRWIWEYCDARKHEVPIITPWHSGTRLRLFLGNDTSRQIYVAGCIDPNEFAFLDRFLQPGMTFVDAGANEGIYSVFAAKRVGGQGTVWAFEPSARELARLRANLELNHLTARIFPLALADSAGQAVLKIATYDHAGQNTLGGFAYQIEAENSVRVEVRPLDEIIEQNPLGRLDLMKVDVEGAELSLFRGAVATLRKYRPVLLFELSEDSLRHQGTSRLDVLDFLGAENYLISSFDRLTGLACAALPGVFGDNMIAVPAEKPLPVGAGSAWPIDASVLYSK
jgi:FkbM family methyltransferase